MFKYKHPKLSETVEIPDWFVAKPLPGTFKDRLLYVRKSAVQGHVVVLNATKDKVLLATAEELRSQLVIERKPLLPTSQLHLENQLRVVLERGNYQP